CRPKAAYKIFSGLEFRRVLFRSIWREAAQLASAYSQVLVVSDTNVAPVYAERLPFQVLELWPGEESKSLEMVAALVDDWAGRGRSVERREGIGGGERSWSALATR